MNTDKTASILNAIMNVGQGAGSDASVAVKAEPALDVVTPQITVSLPTQAGPQGIWYDFNHGVTVAVPSGDWRVRFVDLETGNIIFEGKGENCLFQSTRKDFLNASIEVFLGEEKVFLHDYVAEGKQVAIRFAEQSLSGAIGWLPYAERFAQKHRCRLVIICAPTITGLFAQVYPDIVFIDEAGFEALRGQTYATYTIGFFPDDESKRYDFRLVGEHRIAAYILGVPAAEDRPRLPVPGERPIPERYVVVSSQAALQSRTWNNPRGWYDVVEHLKAAGYRVICLDRAKVSGQGLHWTPIPHGAEDQTGERSLQERATWLCHAAFLVGLSNDLSWLAWAVGTPVVMISGSTHPINEFETPYRVFNPNPCNSCWNDTRCAVNFADFLLCPRNQGTEREFECSRMITASQVVGMIDRVTV